MILAAASERVIRFWMPFPKPSSCIWRAATENVAGFERLRWKIEMVDDALDASLIFLKKKPGRPR